MTNTPMYIGILIAGVIVGLFTSVVYVQSHPAPVAGGIYNNGRGLTIGVPGTNLDTVIATTCDLIVTGALSHVSSTTLPYSCSVPGVTSSFKVHAQLSTSTPQSTRGGFSITSAHASTTNGYVEVMVENSGATGVLSAQSAGSSTSILAWK